MRREALSCGKKLSLSINKWWTEILQKITVWELTPSPRDAGCLATLALCFDQDAEGTDGGL